MTRKLLIFSVVSFLLTCLVPLVEAQNPPYYYSFTHPDKVPLTDPPWMPGGGTMQWLPGQEIWFGEDNHLVMTNKTALAMKLYYNPPVVIDYYVPPPGDPHYPSHFGVSNWPYNYLFAKILPKVPFSGGIQFGWEFIPQPNWQVGALKRYAKGGGADDVIITAEYQCYNLTTHDLCAVMDSSWFGLADVDTLEVTEIWFYPIGVSIDPMGDHFLTAPGFGEGDIVYTDPYGQERPDGGVRWILEGGTGLQAGEVFSLGVTMSGEAPSHYSLFMYDSERDEYFHFLNSTDSDSIPTLTEWGLIFFAVLLMGCMTWVVVRRRKRATVSI